MSQPGTWLSWKGSLVRSGRGEPSPASRPLAGLGENRFPSRSLVCNTGMTTPASRAAGSRRWQVLGDYGHTESWGWGLLLQGWQKCSPSGPRRGQGALPQRRPGSGAPWGPGDIVSASVSLLRNWPREGLASVWWPMSSLPARHPWPLSAVG